MSEIDSEPAVQRQRTRHELRIPIRPGVVIEVNGDFPISPAEWKQLSDVLTAMEPALVSMSHLEMALKAMM